MHIAGLCYLSLELCQRWEYSVCLTPWKTLLAVLEIKPRVSVRRCLRLLPKQKEGTEVKIMI
jgi:hypothetical protein